MSSRVCFTLVASLLLAACSDPQGQSATTADTAAPGRIEADVRFLADDLLEGREAGTAATTSRRCTSPASSASSD